MPRWKNNTQYIKQTDVEAYLAVLPPRKFQTLIQVDLPNNPNLTIRMLLDRMVEVLPPIETKSKWVIVLHVKLNAPPGSFDSDGELVPGEKGEDEDSYKSQY